MAKRTLRAMVAAAGQAERVKDALEAKKQWDVDHYYHPDFTVDELGAVQLFSVKVLAAVARGEVDMNLVCRKALAAQGRDANGVWVGFKVAEAQLLGVK